MLKIDLKLDPASELFLKNLPKSFDKGLSNGLIRGMLYAEGQSKAIFRESGPVHPTILTARTGHLRRSITSGVNEGIGWVGTNVKYGAYHEFGLGKMPERPFIKPSFQGANLNKINEIIVSGIVKEMTK